jgi:YHS domain-containing protein
VRGLKSVYPVVLVFAVVFLAAPAFPASLINTDKLGVAIKGYDAPAYFTTGKPVKGTEEFSYQWKEAVWWFSSREHRGLFAKEPERYAPRYGGYCAYAVSRGYTADIDPEAWTIVQGKLYLNFSKNVREKWRKDIPGNIRKANKNWPGVLDK